MIAVIVVAVFGLLIAIVLGSGWVVRRTLAQAEARVTELCPRPLASTRANCMGHSAAVPQVRGLGMIAYDKELLVFAAGVRTRSIEIPRSTITKATAAQTFNRPGKAVRTAASRVLTVDWHTDAGTDATIGWQLPDQATAEAFATALRR